MSKLNALTKWINWTNDNEAHTLINYEKNFAFTKPKEKYITLYRGISRSNLKKHTSLTDEQLDRLRMNSILRYNTNTMKNTMRTRGLRSWTRDIATAQNFAGTNGYILQANVSSSNVFLNTSFLKNRGNNYNTENEVIVKPSIQQAKIVKTSGKRIDKNHPLFKEFKKSIESKTI
jgi:hypothetical protein